MATDLSHVQAEEWFIRAVVGSGFMRPAPAYEDAEWLITLARRLYSCLERCGVEAQQQAAEGVRRWAKSEQKKRRQAFAETRIYSKSAADWPGNLFSEPIPWAEEFKLTVAVAIHEYCVDYLGANAKRIDPFGDVERIEPETVTDRDWLSQLCLFQTFVLKLTEAHEHIDGMKLAECVECFEQWCEHKFGPSAPAVASASMPGARGASPAEIFEQLLGQFRQGWVESGHALFNVEIRSPRRSMRVGNPDLDTVNYQTEQVIASVSLLHTATAGVEQSSEALAVVKRAEWKSQELIDKFKGLCSQAGATLPLAIRNQLPAIPWMTRNPESRWLTLLAQLNVLTVYDADGNYQESQFIPNPWEASADAIESLRLNSDLPDWPTPEIGIARLGISCQEVAERLERLRKQGEPYSSQQKLAKQIGCATATVHKAIHTSAELKNWAKLESSPRAQSINPVVMQNTPQDRELRPEDEAAIREYLERENLTAEERAFFNSLAPNDQIEFLEGLEDHPKILGRKP